MSTDEVSPAQPAKKKYVRAVGPRLRWVLYFIFGAFALLSAGKADASRLARTRRVGAGVVTLHPASATGRHVRAHGLNSKSGRRHEPITMLNSPPSPVESQE